MIRLAEPPDANQFVQWSVSTPFNGFDSATATYPNLFTLTIEDNAGPLLYIPCHPVLIIESAACRPGITPCQYIKSLLEAKAETERLARQFGMREIHTSSTYEPMRKTLSRHGYTPVAGALKKKI